MPGETVLAAVSAGPDSTALLHALVKLRTRLRCRVRACHVHHGLRGPEADADAKHSASFARSLGVPFTRHRADVRAFARTHKMSVETAARTARYAVLERVACVSSRDRSWNLAPPVRRPWLVSIRLTHNSEHRNGA